MTTPSMIARMTGLILVVSALGACTYRGGDIGDPAIRKFHWFSIVEGEDIRSHCAPGTPDRYRLVYNGIYTEQLRIYEFDSIQCNLRINIVGDLDTSAIDLSDLKGPWRADRADVALDAGTYDRLIQAFAESGMFGPAPAGLDLPARSYFWTAAWCHSGAYGFTAWKYPSPAFDAKTFDSALFALDPTGVPVARAKPVPFDPQWEDRRRRNEVTDFTLTVGRNGLVR